MKDSMQILFVEDNPGDVRLAMIALERSGLLAECHHVSDGEAALKFLNQKGETNEDLPDVIVLDLNLPCLDGREVLLAMKQNPRIQNIPVVILTSSDNETDIEWAYKLEASGYFCKPLTVNGFERIIKQIIQYWPDYNLCREDSLYRARSKEGKS